MLSERESKRPKRRVRTGRLAPVIFQQKKKKRTLAPAVACDVVGHGVCLVASCDITAGLLAFEFCPAGETTYGRALHENGRAPRAVVRASTRRAAEATEDKIDSNEPLL